MPCPVFENNKTMPNLKPNKGQMLKPARLDFCSMLIEEARDITGLSFEKLDERLEISNSHRFFHQKSSKNIDEIQELEGKVAKLLQRAEHKVVIENHTEFDNSFVDSPLFSSVEKNDLQLGFNLRQYNKNDLEFAYELGWPTYGQLKYHQDSIKVDVELTEYFKNRKAVNNLTMHPMHGHWTQVLLQYAWQWGVLWDEGVNRGKGLPWLTKERFGIAKDKTVVDYLSDLVKQHNEMQAALNYVRLTTAGKKLWDEWNDKIKILELFETEDQLNGLLYDPQLEKLEKKIMGEANYLKQHIKEGRSPDLLTLECQYYEKYILASHKMAKNMPSGEVISVTALAPTLVADRKVKVIFIKYGADILFKKI